jgi:hypothetical protein
MMINREISSDWEKPASATRQEKFCSFIEVRNILMQHHSTVHVYVDILLKVKVGKD